MTTNTNDKDEAIKETGRRYGSVADLMRGEGVSREVQQIVTELEVETRVTKQLTHMRMSAGLTQEQLAEKMNCTQSCISKWESGRDEDLDIKTIRGYSQATGQRIGFLIGKPLHHVEAINLHLAALQKRLLALAALARENGELQDDINSFFGKSCFNIMQILAKCQQEMPPGGSVEVKIQMIETPQLHSRPRGKICSAPPELVPA
ncbi:MAG: helix-turn-helix transcriptional regulator [Chthoniobacter sp.]|nr:helix-turn-helix transcriptional regulator [Chthoniobacter sp.]